MKTKKVIVLLCIIFYGSSFPVFAQATTNDVVGWFSLSVKQKIYKRLSYRLMARLRDGNNFTQIKSWYVDGGLFLAVKNNFSVSLNAVYAPSRMNDSYFRSFYQYYLSVNNKFLLNRYWYVSNRVILQHTSHCFIFDNGYEPYSRTDLREKFLLNRVLNKNNRIYIGDEIMTTLLTHVTELRRNRFYLGLNHKFSKQFSADAFFVLQSALNRKRNSNDFIYGITLNYKFKKIVDDD